MIPNNAHAMPEETRLAGKLATLVPFTETHGRRAAYASWLRNPDIVKTLNLPSYLESPISDDGVRDYYQTMISSPTDFFLAIMLNKNDRFIGTAKAGHIDFFAGHADIGVMIGDKNLWGKGIATDCLRALAKYMFGEINLRRLTAGVMANNPSMVRVFQKLGFQQEGCFREQDRLGDLYIDHIHLGCMKKEFIT